MTRIEDMLRETLAETPIATTTPDPVGSLDGRIRRARHRLALGAGLAAVAVVAAVAVPLTTLHNGGRGVQLTVPGTQTPTPNPSSTRAAGQATPITWMSRNANWVASGGAGAWVVSTPTSNGVVRVRQLSDSTGQFGDGFQVQAPADTTTVGDRLVWVTGYIEGARSHIAVDDSVTQSLVEDDQLLGTDQPTWSATDGDDLYVVLNTATGTAVRRFTLAPDGKTIQASRPLSVPGASQIAVLPDHQVWIDAGDQSKLLRIEPVGGGLQVAQQVPWNGSVLGTHGVHQLWSYSGSRLYCLDTRYAATSPSVAQGCRIDSWDSTVGAAADDRLDGTFAALTDSGGRVPVGVAYWNRQDLSRANSANEWRPTAFVDGPQVTSLAAEQVAGVFYTTTSGKLFYWDPTPH